MKLLLSTLAVFAICGCSITGKSNQPHAKEAQQQEVEAVSVPTTARKMGPTVKPRPVIFQRGIHPTVRYDYYMEHPRDFSCKDGDYGCKSCPVGPSNRVIEIKHGSYTDVPDSINVDFACVDINMLVPEYGAGVYSDQFICNRSPQDGFVKYQGRTYSCRKSGGLDSANGISFNLGTIKPGETKMIEIEIPIKQ